MTERLNFPARNKGGIGYVASAIVLTAGLDASLSNAGAQAADPEAIVTALKAVAGNPPKVRATFAKGQCVTGTYTPSDQVARITKSPSFTRPSRVLARFSVGGGNPKVADTNKAVLRGFGFKLAGDGHSSDIVVESAPVHFAKNLDQMLAFLKARIPGADGKPDPGKIKAFSAANPETLNQANFVAAKPLPGSFAGIIYWGVHSFPATNAKGETRFIKFKVVPVGGEITLSDDEAKAKPADFLVQDLEKRISEGGVRFDVLALLDRPGDPTKDVTIRWPDEDSREAVRLGTIVITAIAKNEPCDESIFDPGNLADGIGLPPDEIFAARQTAYAISLSKRQE
jgi:catalase